MEEDPKFSLSNNVFLNKITAISENLNLILIISNEEIATYGVDYNNAKIIVKSTLANELQNKYKSISDIKKLYACCERKIFTGFYVQNASKILPKANIGKYNVGYYVGKLCVKIKPCSECDLGILYEWDCGHIFQVKYCLE